MALRMYQGIFGDFCERAFCEDLFYTVSKHIETFFPLHWKDFRFGWYPHYRVDTNVPWPGS
jgi:hypothetical protein